MEFLYFLEKIRIPVLNECMLFITQLGEETAFLVLALIFFWCVDKKKGYYIMSVGFLGTMANQFLKLVFRIPRPWVLDENFTIVEQAREAAGGYSFPSGHTQSAVGTLGAIAATADKRFLRISCILLAVLVGFSRMYLGVHTPKDVLVAAVMAVILILLLKPVVMSGKEKQMKLLIWAMLGVSVLLLLYVELFPFPADVDEANLTSGLKNAYTMLGCLIGVAVVYVLEKKYIAFQTKAVWWAQILKVLMGLGLVLVVKSGLKAPLESLFGGHYISRSVRYFLSVFVAGCIWPMTFRWFSGLGKKQKTE